MSYTHHTMTTEEALALAAMSTNRSSKSVRNVQDALEEEPRLRDTTNIGVVEERSKSLKRNVFHLIGEVERPEDRKIAEETARRMLGPKAHIENDLSVAKEDTPNDSAST